MTPLACLLRGHQPVTVITKATLLAYAVGGPAYRADGPIPEVVYRRVNGRVSRYLWDDAIKEWLDA